MVEPCFRFDFSSLENQSCEVGLNVAIFKPLSDKSDARPSHTGGLQPRFDIA